MNPNPLSVAKAVVGGARQLLPKSSQPAVHSDPTRWRTVTILCDEQQLSHELASLNSPSSVLETRFVPAPVGRGFELSMRAKPGAGASEPGWHGEEPTQVVRSQLRQLKQQLEAGEVLLRDPQPEGRRSKTLTGAAVDKADAAAGKEGLL